MEITEIIRKYNLRIEAHRKGLIEMEKFNNPSKEVKYSFETNKLFKKKLSIEIL